MCGLGRGPTSSPASRSREARRTTVSEEESVSLECTAETASHASVSASGSARQMAWRHTATWHKGWYGV